MKKRIISLLLCLSVVSSVIPSASAFAAAEESASVSEFISAEDAEKMLIEAFENAEFEMPKDMAVYANTYTEYVYIHNIDELRAIDGHDGGYYELAADIDLAGAEWKPLKITNAVFNGKGHWIYNLKQTAERSIGLIEWSYEDQPNTYMMNTNFSDIDINVTNAPSGSVYVAALGGKAGFEADNCYVSGKVNVDVDAKDIEVVGMMRTTNCKGRLDINVKGKGTKCIIWGIASSTGSDLAANITVNSKHPYFFCAGMSSCKNDSNFVGDIKIERVFDTYINDPDAAVVNAQVNAMTGCKDSSFTGDITETLSDQPTSSTENKSLYQTFISSSENCTYTGDVDVKIVNCPVEKNEASLSFTDIGFSTGCVFNGSTTVDSNAGGSLYLHGIKGGMIRRSGETELTTEYCKECAINGDLKAWGYNYMTVVGLDLANNSVMTGNAEAYAKSDDTRAGVSLITECYDSRYSGTPQLRTGAEEFGFMDALSGSTNCTAKADLKTEHGNVTGISVCDNCTLYGDLHTKSGTAQGITGQGSKCFLYGDVTTDDGQASGISYTTGSNISGTITQKLDDDIMYVSSSSPFYGIYECGNCGRKINSFQKLPDTKHCHLYGDNYAYYHLTKVMYFSEYTDAPTDTGDTYLPGTIPEPDPINYSVKIIREESREPLENAKVYVDGKEYVTDADGMFSVTNGETDVLMRVMYEGKLLHANMNFKPTRNTTNVVKVQDIRIDEETVNPGESEQGVINGPVFEAGGSTFRMFEFPSSISLPVLDNVTVAYDAYRKSYKAVFTTGAFTTDDLYNSVVKGQGYTPAFQKRYDNAKNVWQKLVSGKLDDNELKKMNSRGKKENKPDNGIGFPASVSAMAFIELQSKGKDLVIANGGIVLSCTVGVDYCVPIPAVPAIYVAYGISGTLEGGLTLTLIPTESGDPKLDISGRSTVILTPSIGVGGGVKKVAAVEGGLTGTLRTDLTLPFKSLQDSLKARLSADYYFLLKAFVFDFRYSHTFFSYQIWPQKTKAFSLDTLSANDLSPSSRDYLNTTAQDSRAGTIKSNIYPYSTVASAPLSGGRTLVVWLDDDAARSDFNRTALFYKIHNSDGTWSETAQVNNDGTADFEFVLASKGSKTILLWQNMSKAFDTATIDDMAKSSELYYAEFDGEDWSVPTRLTDNSDYEYDLALSANSSTGAVCAAWVQNDKNSAIPGFENTTESVYTKRLDYAADAEKVYDGLSFVHGIAVSPDGIVCCIYDSDGDPETDGSVLSTTGGSANYTSKGLISSLCYADNEFYFTDGPYILKAGRGGEFADVYEAKTDIMNAKVISNNSKALIYEVQDGFESSLYAAFCRSDSWKEPVPIAKYSEKVRSWDAVAYDVNKIETAAVLADIDVKAGSARVGDTEISEPAEMSETVRLAYDTLAPIEDIEAVYITSDSDIRAGRYADFEIGVSNRSMNSLSDFDVKFTDANGRELYSGKSAAAIAAGDEDVINVSFILPDDFKSGNITAEITSAAIDDADPENNKVTGHFGGVDVSVSLNGAAAHLAGYIENTVENVGSDTADNVVVKITDENGSSIATENIGSIASGEKAKVRTELPAKYAKAKTDTFLFSEVTCSGDEENTYNNTSMYVLEPSEDTGSDEPLFPYGDATANGKVEADDAAMLLQKALISTFKMPVENQTDDWLKYADVVPDGKIKADDASSVLQKALLSTFKMPVENQ